MVPPMPSPPSPLTPVGGVRLAPAERPPTPPVPLAVRNRVEALLKLPVQVPEDASVIDLNRDAFELLRCDRRLVLIPGATHLFEEPGALDEVARLAAAWFAQHLDSRGRAVA